MLLSDALKGEKYTIKTVKLLGESKRRAEELGIIVGEKITPKRNYRFGGGIYIICGTEVALGKKEKKKIEVET